MPAPKAPHPHMTAWVAPQLSYRIRLKPLVDKRKKEKTCPSVEEIREYRKEVREIVKFYVGRIRQRKSDNLLNAVTLTEQKGTLAKISTAAQNLGEGIRARDKRSIKAWIQRLRDAADVNYLGQSTQIVITSHLRQRDILSYRQFLDSIWDKRLIYFICQPAVGSTPWTKNDKDTAYNYADSLLPILDYVAILKKVALGKAPRHSDPDLYFLIVRLAPIWEKITGRSSTHGKDISKSHRYHFFEWIGETLKIVDALHGLSVETVRTIASSEKIKK